MRDFSALTGCTRREPCQRRGQDRVVTLLAAAVSEFSVMGYEAATMSSIAERAKASIGSLYQFFPNKEAVARAVRTRQIKDAQEVWTRLKPQAAAGDVNGFVLHFVRLMTRFVDQHPAFLPLLDAPSTTQPTGVRNQLRRQMGEMLMSLGPRLEEKAADRLAEVVLTINKALMGLYARSRPNERKRITVEYSAVLGAYLACRLADKRADAEPPPRRNGARIQRRT